MIDSSQVSILISTSPIPSHPSTELIDEVIKNVRFWLPEAPVIIMADGVWDKLEHRKEQYAEYLQRLANRYQNTTLSAFGSHYSQAKMTRLVLEADIVKTRYILFNEHDIPLRTDIDINWNAIFDVLQYERAHVVRISGFGEGIHPEHRHFVYGETFWDSAHFYYTNQWSQWPHVSTKEFYLKMLQTHFVPNEIKMIEERMHSVCQIPAGGYIRIWEYVPNSEDKRCFTHREGRAGDPCHWQS